VASVPIASQTKKKKKKERGRYRFAMEAVEQGHLIRVSVAMDVTSVRPRFVFWEKI
jgi:hypothetical protein